MRIVYFGSGPFGLPSLEALAASRHEIAAVVALPDRPQGRRLEIKPSPVRAWAASRGVKIVDYDRSSLGRFEAEAKSLSADVFVVIAFGAILPKSVLALPSAAPLNVHASLLPRYRGAAPIHWAILNGDPETGVTVMRMAEKLDAGDVLVQVKTPVLPQDDYASLSTRLAAIGAEALMAGIELLDSKKAVFTPQDEAKADYARKIVKEDGRLDWTRPAAELSRRVRAFRQWPTSYCFYGGKRLILTEAVEAPGKGRPGEILGASADGGLLAACGDGALRVLGLQPEGRKPMAVAEFLRGASISPGAFLE